MATIDVKDAAGATVAVEKPLAPGRAAAASSRPVAISTEDAALVGALTETAPASDTASSGLNGRLQRIAQRLTTMLTGISLAAGTALIGKVKTKFIVATGSALTRAANQTPYTALDAISDNATPGSVTAKTITVSDVNDDSVALERFRLDSSDTGIAAKSVRVWLYSSDPTASSGVVGGDNLAFSNKKAGFIGTMSGTFRAFSDGSVAVCVPDEGSRVITVPGSGARTIWWQLQALDGFTPSANSTTFTPTAEGFQGAA